MCVAPFQCLISCHGVCIGSRPPLLSLLFSPRSTLSWFSSSIMVYGLRENGTSPTRSPFGSRQSPWRKNRRPRAVVFAWNELGPMPFLFKLYRSTRSTREVLARLRPKFVLSKSPLAFLWPRDRTSAERAKSFPLFVFFWCSSSTPCCLSFRSLSRFSGLIALSLVAVSR